MLHLVGVVLERLLRVEGRIDVDELDLAPVLCGPFWNGRERSERVARVADDEQFLVGTCRAGCFADDADYVDLLTSQARGSNGSTHS